MQAASLTLSGVSVRRGRRNILDVPAMQIRAGEMVGIIGTNGAGKTTLLNVCTGLIRPNRGSVLLGAHELTRINSWRKANLRRHIGYIPQSAQYNQEIPYTLREIVTMGRASARGLLRRLQKQDYAIVDQWIERLGLTARSNQIFGSLSGGEQQKTLIARAMAQQPQLLLLDEPCANLDFKWKHRITDIIQRLYAEMKITILMVSHETSVLPTNCTRVVLLHEGRIRADGAPQDVLTSDRLSKVYRSTIGIQAVGNRLYAIGRPHNSGDL